MATIRPVQAGDLDAIYAISLATGSAGEDAAPAYADGRLIGHIYSAPYVLLEARLAFVVEDEAGVGGFAVGTADTVAWEERLEQLWWPALRLRYPRSSGEHARRWPQDQRRITMIHRPPRTPASITGQFPAHLHVNLLPRMRGRGFGRQLVGRWLAALGKAGATATHVAVNHANAGALQFWGRMGFSALPTVGLPRGRTVWMGRAWGGVAASATLPRH